MNSDIINDFVKSGYINRPDIKVGDTVRMHLKIKEGNKERVQIFEGIVISISGSGMSKNVTVRKMSYGVGVEKIIPLNMPTLEKVEVIKRGKTKKSKLYYVRRKIGKRALDVANTESVYIVANETKEQVADKKTETSNEVNKPVQESAKVAAENIE